MKKNRTGNYYEELYELLQDPAEALSYLKAAASDEDDRIFAVALDNVNQVYGGNITALFNKKARPKKVNRKLTYSAAIKTHRKVINPTQVNVVPEYSNVVHRSAVVAKKENKSSLAAKKKK